MSVFAGRSYMCIIIHKYINKYDLVAQEINNHDIVSIVPI